MKDDIYDRITNRIVESLEAGVRPWLKPWNAGHAAGRITRPIRHNGQPYSGINVFMLWMEAEARGYSAPIWMTFRQAQERWSRFPGQFGGFATLDPVSVTPPV